MSYSLRERLRMKIAKAKKDMVEKYAGVELKDLEWLTVNYIEQICRDGDKKCKKIDPLKAVDQVIDEMTDEAFEKFMRGLLMDLKARLEKARKRERERQKNTKDAEENEEQATENDEETEKTSESDSQTEEEIVA